MDQNSNEIKAIFMRAEQRKNQKKMKERRELEAKRKVDVHRNILIGKLVCQYFPHVMKYQPQHSRAGNEIEFAEFENTLRWLSEHIELLNNMRDNPQNEI